MGGFLGGGQQAVSVQAPVRDVEASAASEIDPNESAKRAAAATKRRALKLSANRRSLRNDLINKDGRRPRRSVEIK